MFLLLKRQDSDIKVLFRMTQIEPPMQVRMLIERKLYSTGLKFCDFLILNAYEGLR